MTEVNIFELATRKDLRINSNRGLLTIQDLWQLPLTSGSLNLDNLAIGIAAKIKEQQTESFVERNKSVDPDLQLTLDILKHIIAVKVREEQAHKDATEKATKRKRLEQALAKRRDADLDNLSSDELQAQLNELND